MLNYRNLCPNEAEQFWELMNRMDYETKYMLYEPGERMKNLPRIEALIRNSVDGDDFLLAAEAEDGLVGYLSAQKGMLKRTAHTAYIVVGILKEYCGKGIGTEFFRRLEVWAEEKNVVRLELTVVCENKAAVRLYEKSGFVTEGVRRKAVLVDGKYMDEFYMAKIR